MTILMFIVYLCGSILNNKWFYQMILVHVCVSTCTSRPEKCFFFFYGSKFLVWNPQWPSPYSHSSRHQKCYVFGVRKHMCTTQDGWHKITVFNEHAWAAWPLYTRTVTTYQSLQIRLNITDKFYIFLCIITTILHLLVLWNGDFFL